MDLQRELLKQQRREESGGGQRERQPGEGEAGQPVTSAGPVRHAGDGRPGNGRCRALILPRRSGEPGLSHTDGRSAGKIGLTYWHDLILLETGAKIHSSR